MLGWRYSGFSVHNQVRVAAEDAESRKKLAGYMLRAPLSLAKMSYEAASDTVIYRSKMHLGLKRNFQLNGVQYHHDLEKRQQIQELEKTLSAENVRAIFLTQLSGKLRAALILGQVVNLVLASIKPYPGAGAVTS